MKNILIFLFLPIVFLICIPSYVYSQDEEQIAENEQNTATSEAILIGNEELASEEKLDETDYNNAIEEYKKRLEEYRLAREGYVLAKAQYLRSGTERSKTEAKDKTTDFLEARDSVVIAHLEALKEKIKIAKGITDSQMSLSQIIVREEINWFENHKSAISSAGTLDDLVNDSKAAESHYKKTEEVIYETLSLITSGRVLNYQLRMVKKKDLLKDKINDIRFDERDGYSFSTDKMQVLDRWVFDSENLINRAEGKSDYAVNLISEIGKSREPSYGYNNIFNVLSEARQFLKETGDYLIEIINEIKIAEE